jgi:hypothetical protein
MVDALAMIFDCRFDPKILESLSQTLNHPILLKFFKTTNVSGRRRQYSAQECWTLTCSLRYSQCKVSIGITQVKLG